MQNNPLAGPHHVLALANALERERRPGAYVKPPSTGGEQISVRLSETLLAHFDVLGKAAGWTRVQVLTALVERGLFDLYEVLSDETGESIMESLAGQIVPTMHNESALLRAAKRVMRDVAGEGCMFTSAPLPEQFWVEAARRPAGIPRMRVVIDSHAAADFQRAANQQGAIDSLRRSLAGEWTEAMAHAGTDWVFYVTPGVLLPLAPAR